MADETKTFAEEQVEREPSELERLTKRVNDFTIAISPTNAQTVTSIMEAGLAKGNYKLADLDALVSLREETTKGLIEYNTVLQNAQQRMGQLQMEEQERLAREREERETAMSGKIAEERIARKKAEQELAIVQAQLNALSNVQGNVTSAPTTPVTGGNAPSVTSSDTPDLQPKPKVPGKTSPAFAVARALNPVKEEEVQEEEQQIELPISEDKELVKKVEETKKSFKEWEEETVNEIEEREIEIPEDAKGIEEFFEEVEDVAESVEEEVEEELKVAEEDTTTTPTFPITGGNAPNVRQALSSGDSVEAPVTKEIKTYDSVEDLQAAVDEKNQQQEEEFEEVTIPNESELKAMTKGKISEVAEGLGFESVSTTQTKDVMIENFVKDTESFIDGLKESGDFISASDGNDDEDETVRDGGYF
jgi:hypothetical protein